PIPQPRVLCERGWSVSKVVGGYEDRARLYGGALVDPQGNLVVTGSLGGDYDFGDGLLDVPWPEQPAPPWPAPAPLPYQATLVLKLDSDCKLLWSRVLLPLGQDVMRSPIALGFDAAGNLGVVSQSDRYAANGTKTMGSIELAVLSMDGATLSEKRFDTGYHTRNFRVDAARPGKVLISGQLSDFAPLDWGAGVLADPTRGHNFQVLLTSEGGLLGSAILGTPDLPLGLQNERLGADGELITVEANVPDYFGSALAGPTLIAFDAQRRERWRHELHASIENAETTVALAIAEDGRIAMHERYANAGEADTSGFSEWTRDGAPVWSVPVSYTERDGFSTFQLAHGANTLSALGSLRGDTKLGNGQLAFEPSYESADSYYVLQLARGGAPRWAQLVGRPEMAMQIVTTREEDVFLSGYEWPDLHTGVTRVFVRKYGSVAAE
ncbi:MAG: hypothetical protein ABW352_06335, partial [Polyangiales bacterium]